METSTTNSRYHRETKIQRINRRKTKTKAYNKIYHKAYYIKNQAKVNTKSLQWAKENPEARKNIYIKQRHGITLIEYRDKFIAQQELCGICGVKMELGQKAHLDHNHKTGTLREFLCWHCNRGLGSFKDSITLLQKASNYLTKHSEETN